MGLSRCGRCANERRYSRCRESNPDFLVDGVETDGVDRTGQMSVSMGWLISLFCFQGVPRSTLAVLGPTVVN
jgi:hypothetical protein